MNVKQLMAKDYLTLDNHIKIIDAAKYFFNKKFQSIPIVDAQHKPVGIVSTNDFLKTLNGADTNSLVDKILSPNFETIHEDEPLENLLSYPIDIVLVINQTGHLTGIVTKTVMESIINNNQITSNPLLIATINSLNIGFLAVDLNERVMLCNSMAEKIIGISIKKAVGRRFSHICNDDLLTNVLKSGIVIDGSKKNAGGVVFTCSGYPVTIDQSVIGAFALFQDFTNKKTLLKELANTKALNKELEGIIESSYDGIVVTDEKGKLLRISKSYSRICGIPYENLQNYIGNYVGDSEKNEDAYERGSVNDSLLVLSNQKSTTISSKLWNSRQLAITGNPIFNDDGNIDRVVWNIRDISELNTLKREINENKNIAARYHTELEELRARQSGNENVVIHSQEMKKIVETAMRVANVDATVLITGETGVGKEIIAMLIHKASSRRKSPYILVNCGAIPENLLESELFGYESGAFTGAKRNGKIGLVEAANNGTLLLDEIGDMPMSLQIKLLRVLQNQQIVRIGGTRQIKLNLRIIAATNQNLRHMVKENSFREDLFYRLNVIPIHIPPLRNRKDDIIPLARIFTDRSCAKYNIKKIISKEAFEILETHSWPGNVRELQNLIERVVITTEDQLILPNHFHSYFERNREMSSTPIKVNKLLPLKEAKEALERELIGQVLSNGFSTRKAANILGVDHSTIVRKMNKYKLLK